MDINLKEFFDNFLILEKHSSNIIIEDCSLFDEGLQDYQIVINPNNLANLCSYLKKVYPNYSRDIDKCFSSGEAPRISQRVRTVVSSTGMSFTSWYIKEIGGIENMGFFTKEKSIIVDEEDDDVSFLDDNRVSTQADSLQNMQRQSIVDDSMEDICEGEVMNTMPKESILVLQEKLKAKDSEIKTLEDDMSAKEYELSKISEDNNTLALQIDTLEKRLKGVPTLEEVENMKMKIENLTSDLEIATINYNNAKKNVIDTSDINSELLEHYLENIVVSDGDTIKRAFIAMCQNFNGNGQEALLSRLSYDLYQSLHILREGM